MEQFVSKDLNHIYPANKIIIRLEKITNHKL